MVKSKTKIEKQLQRKTNPKVVETIISAKKKDAWLEIASLLSTPRRKQIDMNLNEIDKEAKEGDVIIVPGKILSQGEISKKIKIVGIGFSENAKAKLEKAGTDFSLMIDEIKSNPDAKSVRILK